VRASLGKGRAAVEHDAGTRNIVMGLWPSEDAAGSGETTRGLEREAGEQRFETGLLLSRHRRFKLISAGKMRHRDYLDINTLKLLIGRCASLLD
jgi:hypothetical protein